MRRPIFALVICSLAVLTIQSPSTATAQSVSILKKDAEIWVQRLEIRGEVQDLDATDGTLYVNEESFDFTIEDEAFKVEIILVDRENEIVAVAGHAGMEVRSDTLNLTLRYQLRPELHAYARVNKGTVELTVEEVANPLGEMLTYEWSQDENNPDVLDMGNGQGESIILTIPEGPTAGEYYFDVAGNRDSGDAVHARTMISVSDTSVVAFDIENDRAGWIDRAVIYEVTPYNFVPAGKFQHVTARIPELADLGINTLWLQPTYVTCCPGQGYGVTDYFAVRPDYGTESDLRDLIAAARDYNMRILLDFVPNHSHIDHRYGKDAQDHGELSHYFDYYQREMDTAPYSRHYAETVRGEMTFIRYFWEDLPNLNYDNAEVRRWMTEAGKYWIEKFDIDGYRIDAVWGVNARNPEFMQDWRVALKRIKPEIMLLGEDKATVEDTFDKRFDVAYDWAPGEGWVSQWNWEINFSSNHNVSHTIFNSASELTRATLLRNALTNRGEGFHPNASILRFMENNDTPRFLQVHGLERTKMVAALMFGLHGVPMLYQGQEIGFTAHPYETFAVYADNSPMRDQDSHGLFDFYQYLIHLRVKHPALYSSNFASIGVMPGQRVYGFHRWVGDENIFGVINMGEAVETVTLNLPIADLGLDEGAIYYLTDLLTGNYVAGTPDALPDAQLTVDGYSTQLLLLGLEPAIVNLEQVAGDEIPTRVDLAQNFPNPFNPSTVIEFSLPRSGSVDLSVFDALGRRVTRLASGELPAGVHSYRFDGAHLASGVYYYRLDFDGHIMAKQMVLLR